MTDVIGDTLDRMATHAALPRPKYPSDAQVASSWGHRAHLNR